MTNDFVEALPDIYGRHDPRPDDLIGATIVRFGTVPNQEVEGGGLVIDYVPNGSTEERRIVFAFNELGMWVEFSGPVKTG